VHINPVPHVPSGKHAPLTAKPSGQIFPFGGGVGGGVVAAAPSVPVPAAQHILLTQVKPLPHASPGKHIPLGWPLFGHDGQHKLVVLLQANPKLH